MTFSTDIAARLGVHAGDEALCCRVLSTYLAERRITTITQIPEVGFEYYLVVDGDWCLPVTRQINGAVVARFTAQMNHLWLNNVDFEWSRRTIVWPEDVHHAR